MKLTGEQVRHVAVLARVRLTREEEIELTEQLDHILQYMNKLAELDTSTVAPFTHAIDALELRADKITNQPNADVLLANAPDRDGDFFKVPKILE